MFEPYFGLSRQPFQLSPDPTFFYGSRGHKRAYSYLQYGLYQGEGFIVLTGEVGAGKTTLIRNLLKDLDHNRMVAAQLVSTQLDADSILRAVATAFGLAVREQSKARVLAELEAFFVSLVPKNKRALLVVDEAQNLAPDAVEELRMLSNFQIQSRTLLQSFLVGQPELRQLMRSTGMQQLRQRVLAAYHLGPLDADETRAYIEHRLKQVGWKKDPAIDEDAFALIHAYTGGIPRRINTLCTRALLSAFLSEKHVIGKEDLEGVIREYSEEFGEQIAAEEPAPVASPATAIVPQLSGLERRVHGVERAMGMTVNLIRQLIRRRQEPDGRESKTSAG
jgi:putative secretion ATPase (PEP-CTERM system associated)